VKNIIIFFGIITLMFSGFHSSIAQEHQKIAQTGCQFLSVITDARAAAMGGAVTTLDMGSASLFFNPAGIADMRKLTDISASYNDWITDIQHNAFSLAINPLHGRFGVLGFTVQTVDYGGNFYGTIEDRTGASDYINTGELSPSAMAFGIGYAKALSDRFSVGAQVRWINQDFGTFTVPVTVVVSEDSSSHSTEQISYNKRPVAYDFGTIFKTGYKSLAFGMSVRNFSKEMKYIEEGFQLPLVFTLGIHIDLMDFVEMAGPRQSAIFSINASHFRSHAEQFIAAIDYTLMNAISLRMGYVNGNDEDGINYGVGFSLIGLSIDYAYTPFGVFDSVQRFSVRLSL